MKSIVLILLLFMSMVSWGQTTKKVLFLGNSYTAVNNLPSLIESLATAEGNTLQKDQNTPGGYTLEGHSTNVTSLSKIEQEQWDYVVLQEQSQRPSFPTSQVQQEVYPFAEVLVDSIYSNYECSTPLFYNTWGRRDGDPQWDSIDTFEEMNLRLYNAYDYMSEVANGKNAPVGIGFQHVFYDGSSPIAFVDLYATDGSHPSIYGSYLAACIFNNMIFNTVSTGNNYIPGGVSSSEANYLQGVADHVVYDVDSVRTNYTTLTQNGIQINVNGLSVDFTSTLNFGNFDYWNFGDGNTSTDLNASHTYGSSGVYEVYLVSSDNCVTDSTSVILDLGVGTSNIFKNNSEEVKVFPNPSVDGFINLKNLRGRNAQLYMVNGKFIQNITSDKIKLSAGIYLLKIGLETKRIVVL